MSNKPKFHERWMWRIEILSLTTTQRERAVRNRKRGDMRWNHKPTHLVVPDGAEGRSDPATRSRLNLGKPWSPPSPAISFIPCISF